MNIKLLFKLVSEEVSFFLLHTGSSLLFVILTFCSFLSYNYHALKQTKTVISFFSIYMKKNI